MQTKRISLSSLLHSFLFIMLYFSSLPLPYPLNPIIYLVTLFPLAIILLTQLPKLFLIVYGVKLVIHILDTFCNKKENKEGEDNGKKVMKCFSDSFDEMKVWAKNAWNEVSKYCTNVKTSFGCGQCRAEMTESETDFSISIDLPGMKRENINVQIEGNEVTISGNRVAETVEGNERKSIFSERLYGEFSKKIVLPESADMESIIAKYDNGILSLLIHKKEGSVKDKKSIVIE